MAKFFIMALPRSRTAWLSRFLSADETLNVAHDLAIDCNSIEDYIRKFDKVDGVIETAGMLGWRIVLDRRPNTKIIAIVRDLQEVKDDLARQGVNTIPGELDFRASLLDQAAKYQPEVTAIPFDDLKNYNCCAWIYQHCVGELCPLNYWEKWDKTDVQIDMPARLALLGSRYPFLETFKAQLAAENDRLCQKLN